MCPSAERCTCSFHFVSPISFSGHGWTTLLNKMWHAVSLHFCVSYGRISTWLRIFSTTWWKLSLCINNQVPNPVHKPYFAMSQSSEQDSINNTDQLIPSERYVDTFDQHSQHLVDMLIVLLIKVRMRGRLTMLLRSLTPRSKALWKEVKTCTNYAHTMKQTMEYERTRRRGFSTKWHVLFHEG